MKRKTITTHGRLALHQERRFLCHLPRPGFCLSRKVTIMPWGSNIEGFGKPQRNPGLAMLKARDFLTVLRGFGKELILSKRDEDNRWLTP